MTTFGTPEVEATTTRLPWPLIFQIMILIVGVGMVEGACQSCLLLLTALIVAAATLPAARVGERYRVLRGVTVKWCISAGSRSGDHRVLPLFTFRRRCRGMSVMRTS